MNLNNYEQSTAHQLKWAIESCQPTETIADATRQLIVALGGRPDLVSRDAGAAALYIVALMAAKG